MLRRRFATLLPMGLTTACRTGNPFDRPDPASVRFQLKTLPPGEGGEQRFEASYGQGAEAARFEFRMRVRARTALGAGEPEGAARFEFGEGELVARPGSNATELLTALCAALEAGSCPQAGAERVERLGFRLAVLGRELSRPGSRGQIAGSFSRTPKGGWTAMKLFIGTGGDEEAEVFFNLNPERGVGEFALKDPAYGTVVVRELARVL